MTYFAISDFSPIARLVLIISGGTLVLLPLTAFKAMSGPPVTQTFWGWKTVALAVTASIIPGAASYLTYSTLQNALGAALAGLTLYLRLLDAAVLAAVFLDEALKG